MRFAFFLLLGNSNSGEDVLELARLVQASNDITATDKFAANVELRDGRPVAEGFDALADVGILQYVHCLEWRNVYSEASKNGKSKG